jgi:hypothetical protein
MLLRRVLKLKNCVGTELVPGDEEMILLATSAATGIRSLEVDLSGPR